MYEIEVPDEPLDLIEVCQKLQARVTELEKENEQLATLGNHVMVLLDERVKRETETLQARITDYLAINAQLVSKIETLEAENAALRDANQWHPASEKPNSGKGLYLVALETGVVDTAIYLNSNGWLIANQVILWRELPTPPEEEKIE